MFSMNVADGLKSACASLYCIPGNSVLVQAQKAMPVDFWRDTFCCPTVLWVVLRGRAGGWKYLWQQAVKEGTKLKQHLTTKHTSITPRSSLHTSSRCLRHILCQMWGVFQGQSSHYV